MLDQAQLEALLGRSLTSYETTNLALYLDISKERLTDLLCDDVFTYVSEDRMFDSRDGYSTLPVGVFTAVNSVTLDGDTIDAADYTVMQGSKYNGSWKNLIVFKTRMLCDKLYTVNADWGFETTTTGEGDEALTTWTAPADLRLLLARMFNVVSSAQRTDSRLQSKKIEDTSFTYRDVTLDDQFLNDNGSTIAKYSSCQWSEVRHGRVPSISNC